MIKHLIRCNPYKLNITQKFVTEKFIHNIKNVWTNICFALFLNLISETSRISSGKGIIKYKMLCPDMLVRL